MDLHATNLNVASSGGGAEELPKEQEMMVLDYMLHVISYTKSNSSHKKSKLMETFGLNDFRLLDSILIQYCAIKERHRNLTVDSGHVFSGLVEHSLQQWLMNEPKGRAVCVMDDEEAIISRARIIAAAFGWRSFCPGDLWLPHFKNLHKWNALQAQVKANILKDIQLQTGKEPKSTNTNQAFEMILYHWIKINFKTVSYKSLWFISKKAEGILDSLGYSSTVSTGWLVNFLGQYGLSLAGTAILNIEKLKCCLNRLPKIAHAHEELGKGKQVISKRKVCIYSEPCIQGSHLSTKRRRELDNFTPVFETEIKPNYPSTPLKGVEIHEKQAKSNQLGSHLKSNRLSDFKSNSSECQQMCRKLDNPITDTGPEIKFGAHSKPVQNDTIEIHERSKLQSLVPDRTLIQPSEIPNQVEESENPNPSTPVTVCKPIGDSKLTFAPSHHGSDQLVVPSTPVSSIEIQKHQRETTSPVEGSEMPSLSVSVTNPAGAGNTDINYTVLLPSIPKSSCKNKYMYHGNALIEKSWMRNVMSTNNKDRNHQAASKDSPKPQNVPLNKAPLLTKMQEQDPEISKNGGSTIESGLPDFHVIKDKTPEDIFLLAETVLLFPLDLLDERNVSVLSCTNMDGSDRKPLVLVGHVKNPRWVTNKALPVTYISNEHALLDKKLIARWLIDFDRYMLHQGRRVVVLLQSKDLYMDISFEHELRAVSLVFLGSAVDTFSRLMELLKRNYRKFQLSSSMMTLKSGASRVRLPLEQAIDLISKAWEDLDAKCIWDCFADGIEKLHCMKGGPEPTKDLQKQAKVANTLSENYCKHFPFAAARTFHDWVHIDEDLEASIKERIALIKGKDKLVEKGDVDIKTAGLAKSYCGKDAVEQAPEGLPQSCNNPCANDMDVIKSKKDSTTPTNPRADIEKTQKYETNGQPFLSKIGNSEISQSDDIELADLSFLYSSKIVESILASKEQGSISSLPGKSVLDSKAPAKPRTDITPEETQNDESNGQPFVPKIGHSDVSQSDDDIELANLSFLYSSKTVDSILASKEQGSRSSLPGKSVLGSKAPAKPRTDITPEETQRVETNRGPFIPQIAHCETSKTPQLPSLSNLKINRSIPASKEQGFPTSLPGKSFLPLLRSKSPPTRLKKLLLSGPNIGPTKCIPSGKMLEKSWMTNIMPIINKDKPSLDPQNVPFIKTTLLTEMQQQDPKISRNGQTILDLPHVLHLKDIDPKDIFLLEETALLFPVHPEEYVYNYIDDGLPLDHLARKRISMLYCTNMDGSDRKPLVLVGSRKEPVYRHEKIDLASLPVIYTSDEHGLIDNKLISRWLLEFERYMLLQGRRVILLMQSKNLQNPDIEQELKAMPSVFLGDAVDTFARLTELLKTSYRKRQLSTSMMAFESGESREKFTLKCAIDLISEAWNGLDSSCIWDCFVEGVEELRCMKGRPESKKDVHNDAKEANLLFEAYRQHISFPAHISFHDWVNIDVIFRANKEIGRSTNPITNEEKERTMQWAEAARSAVARPTNPIALEEEEKLIMQWAESVHVKFKKRLMDKNDLNTLARSRPKIALGEEQKDATNGQSFRPQIVDVKTFQESDMKMPRFIPHTSSKASKPIVAVHVGQINRQSFCPQIVEVESVQDMESSLGIPLSSSCQGQPSSAAEKQGGRTDGVSFSPSSQHSEAMSLKLVSLLHSNTDKSNAAAEKLDGKTTELFFSPQRSQFISLPGDDAEPLKMISLSNTNRIESTKAVEKHGGAVSTRVMSPSSLNAVKFILARRKQVGQTDGESFCPKIVRVESLHGSEDAVRMGLTEAKLVRENKTADVQNESRAKAEVHIKKETILDDKIKIEAIVINENMESAQKEQVEMGPNYIKSETDHQVDGNIKLKVEPEFDDISGVGTESMNMINGSTLPVYDVDDQEEWKLVYLKPEFEESTAAP